MAFALWWFAAQDNDHEGATSSQQRAEGNGLSSAPAIPALTDAERTLIDRIRLGDHSAFEQLFREHHLALTDFALGYVASLDDANDVIADVFVTLWDRRQTWQPVSIRRYLYGAVRNLALTRRRDAQRRLARDARLAQNAADAGMNTDASVQDHLEHREQFEALDAMIATLPPARRVMLMLRWRDGLSFDEIAALTGTTKAAVQMQISRALKAVRERFPKALIAGD